MKSILRILLVLAAAIATSAAQVVVFGDSLSDTGNVRANNFLGIPGPLYGYTNGRFTNGTDTTPAARKHTGVWHEQFCEIYGYKLATPSEKGGLNFAYGGATTEDSVDQLDLAPGINVRIKNLGAQVREYLAKNKPRRNTRVMMWIGGNDLLDDPSSALAAADRVEQAVRTLIDAGAYLFVIPNLPPLGATPEGQANAEELNAATITFNTALSERLNALYLETGAYIFQPDVYRKFQQIQANPAAAGFTNITDPCQGKSAVNPDTYLFWDDLHPTTQGHYLVARLAAWEYSYIFPSRTR